MKNTYIQLQHIKPDQITSTRQRKMHALSPNNPVRRRLIFDENVKDQTEVDNFDDINHLQEYETHHVLSDREEKSQKWNFDFLNEEALHGRYEWFRKDGDNWVVMKPQGLKNDDDKFLPIQFNNENTPIHVRDESVPIIRKRKNGRENSIGSQSVKRRVDFDRCNFIR